MAVKMIEMQKKAQELISKMTLEEKVSQIMHSSKEIKHLQIPSYNWWNEALHGVARSGTATVFPQAIALAATFDPELIYKAADIISTEARAKFNIYQEYKDHDMYKGITFWSPNINIFRDPRWGRGQETYGEDPYLTSLMAISFIKGLQGEDNIQLKTAACAKHFAVHSGPENDRHHFDVNIDLYDLWNTYLPAFEASVKEAKVEGIMGAYNRLYGKPCCGSEFLLKEILREKWGFKGYIVSDCWAINNFHEKHKVTSSPEESVALAINSGCDLECGNLYKYILDGVKNGLIKESTIDESVQRLYITRMKLGILGKENKSKYNVIKYQETDSEFNRKFNLEIACRSLVLLKNKGVLPLNKNNIKTIGIIGPNADSRRALEGNYHGIASQYITVLDGIRYILKDTDARILYSKGSHIFKDYNEELTLNDDLLAEASAIAKISDINILCLGLNGDIEGEENETGDSRIIRGDRKDIYLPLCQQNLLKAVIKASDKKPLIIIMISGSAISMQEYDKNADAVLQAFYPGALGGLAIAEVLFGKFSPSGKLPVTFYKDLEDLPSFDDYSMKDRTYRYFKGEPLYPFGFGLGYSKFSIKNLEVSEEFCSVEVKNEGSIAAHETVQIYISSPGQKENRDLCGIKSVFLQPEESRKIKININKNAFFRYDDKGNIYKIKGKHIISAGFTQPDKKSIELSGQFPLVSEINII